MKQNARTAASVLGAALISVGIAGIAGIWLALVVAGILLITWAVLAAADAARSTAEDR